MSPWLFIAGALCCALACIHSILGERLIFRRWRDGLPIPRSHAGIIRASWHVLSLLAVAVGLVLWRVPLDGLSAAVLIVAFALSAALIAVWTRFRHPGWLVITVIALLVLASRL